MGNVRNKLNDSQMTSLTWNRSLSLLLGRDLGEGSGPAIQRLVDDGIAESRVLEFKREVYPSSKEDKRELATDVAAMSNGGGGVILLGVDEGDSVAAAIMPIPASDRDTELRRIHEVVAQRIAPVPVIHVEWIAVDGGGVIAIVAPPSRSAPHAVGRDGSPTNPYHCWPRRDGTRTRYLGEFEIAEAYSTRARLLRSDQTRLGGATDDLERLLDTGDERVWLTGTLVPSIPGSFQLADWDRQRIFGEISQPWSSLASEQRISPGHLPDSLPRLRRLRLGDGKITPTARPVVELHTDGTVASAEPVSASNDVEFAVTGLPPVPGREAQPQTGVPDQWVFRYLCRVLGGLVFLSGTVAGGSGADSSLRISLNANGARIGRWSGGSRFVPLEDQVGENLVIELTFDLDAASDPSGYRALLGTIASDLWNGMGFPRCPYISRDGHVTDGGRELLAWG